jgi:carbon-monoxide dehydrogenase large subunit
VRLQWSRVPRPCSHRLWPNNLVAKWTVGFGGFNSRQAVMASSSAHLAATAVRQKPLSVASHLLEVDAGDLDIEGNQVIVKGAKDMKVSLGRIAKIMAGAPGFALPGNLPPGLEATESVIIDQMTYANGTAAAEVEVDIGTAAVMVKRSVHT